MPGASEIGAAFRLARERYVESCVDSEGAIDRPARIPISLHCWQRDDLGGFENDLGLTGGGIQATGNYSGKARTADELRADTQTAFRRSGFCVDSEREPPFVPYSGHLGFEIEDGSSLRQRMLAAGFEESTVPNNHPHRRRVYFLDPDGNDWEFVQGK